MPQRLIKKLDEVEAEIELIANHRRSHRPVIAISVAIAVAINLVILLLTR